MTAPTATIPSETALDMSAAKAPMDTSPELEDGEDPAVPGLEPAPELPGLAVPAVPDELRLRAVPVLAECTVVAAPPAETVAAVVGGAAIDAEVVTAITELKELESLLESST